MTASRFGKILIPTILVFVGLGLAVFAQKYPLISDSIGYVYAAERLANGEGLSYEDTYNQSAGPYFSLYAFQIQREDSDLNYLGYPPGLPILLAGAVSLFGSEFAIRFFIPLMALLGIYMTVLLGTEMGQRRAVGLVAAVILLATPAFWEYGTAVWSEIPSMTFVVAGT